MQILSSGFRQKTLQTPSRVLAVEINLVCMPLVLADSFFFEAGTSDYCHNGRCKRLCIQHIVSKNSAKVLHGGVGLHLAEAE